MTDFVRRFRDVDGDLRLIVSLTHASWEIEYVRESLEDEYTPADFEQTYRSHMASQVAGEDIGRVVDGGDFVCQQYVFEEVVVFQFPTSRYEGFFVSYDWDDSIPVTEVVDAARDLESSRE